MISPLLVTFLTFFFVIHRSQAVLVMMELPSRLKEKQAEGNQAQGEAGSRRKCTCG